MTPTRPATVLDQARDLREALEALVSALGRGEATAVLAAEPALQAALAPIGQPGTLTTEERVATSAELHLARTALLRCRAMGVATAEVTGATLDVLGGPGAYSRHGAGKARAPRGRDLHARV